ncbi:M15 family metallopeptidase [Patescibacteria group bacterium]|nr:M15 family metallopeptidase [Patescibacteria group bacterium]
MNSRNGNILLVFLLALMLVSGVYWYTTRLHTTPGTQSEIVDYSDVAISASQASALTNTNTSVPLDDVFSFVEEEPESIPQVPARVMCGDFPCYAGSEFLDIYNNFEQSSNVEFLNTYIYQRDDVDTYLVTKAESRGYQQRGFGDEVDMVVFENVQTRPEVRDAYVSLRNAMSKDGLRLHFVSGYRSSGVQRYIVTNKLDPINLDLVTMGVYDAQIDEVLSRSALPGYSKHHSGYAVDFGCGNDYLVYSFADTDCYAWMSNNNFENTKKYGFIPSYPNGVTSQGPDPEPWEFVWVGSENLN